MVLVEKVDRLRLVLDLIVFGRLFQLLAILLLSNCLHRVLFFLGGLILLACLVLWECRLQEGENSLDMFGWSWFCCFFRTNLQHCSLYISCNINALSFLKRGPVWALYFERCISLIAFLCKTDILLSSFLHVPPQATTP